MIFPPMQVKCPSTATYVSKHVIDQITEAFQLDVLHGLEGTTGHNIKDLLVLLHEGSRDLDCEWEGSAEVTGGTLAVTGGQRIGWWTCPNCGSYNEIDVEQEA